MDDDAAADGSKRPFFFHEEEEVEEHHNILSWAFSSPPPPPHHDPFSLLGGLPIPVVSQPPPPSAFTQYRASTGANEYPENAGGERPNVNRRLIRFLRIIAMGARAASSEEGAASSRAFRHMMRERLRRERLSQGYADLHCILSSRSKGDKISIVQSARECLQELQEERDNLRRRNTELELQAHGSATGTPAAIRVQAAYRSSSPLDSAIAVLQSLKHMELEASAVRTEFAGGSLSVEVVFGSEVAREEVEREMKAALAAAESQF